MAKKNEVESDEVKELQIECFKLVEAESQLAAQLQAVQTAKAQKYQELMKAREETSKKAASCSAD